MFLQDIAVKLNDFGVLVQLLVVDFFKFCFRNANGRDYTIVLTVQGNAYLVYTYNHLSKVISIL